ncbi:EF-P lysine aminoacylase EpmA [Salinisphaera sp. T31B1]|uniref:EF-P lysine aminoacylase EpmA n=1 Tax=Salinisphaera sp. T31B1 TaxID=727963 RepID=UPI003341DCBA
MNPPDWRPSATPAVLRRRAALLADLRAFMDAAGLCEIDSAHIGRAAPSERALDCLAVGQAGFLQPSPEHGLKRLLAAGMGPIYQLSHVFRAGEVGRWHNPEFSMLEWYRPGADLSTMIAETETLIARIAGVACAPRLRYRAAFEACIGLDPWKASTRALARAAIERGVAPVPPAGDEDRVYWLDLLMSLVVQPTLGHDGPVCVAGFPAADAVLVEHDSDEPGAAARFECVWRGVELANGAQELLDASQASTRMDREIAARAAADRPAQPRDERLLAAMRAGLPACGGVALGVDRLLALMLERDNVAEVMPFAWAQR